MASKGQKFNDYSDKTKEKELAKDDYKERYEILKDSSIHLMNTKQFVNLTVLLFLCPEKVLR